MASGQKITYGKATATQQGSSWTSLGYLYGAPDTNEAYSAMWASDTSWIRVPLTTQSLTETVVSIDSVKFSAYVEIWGEEGPLYIDGTFRIKNPESTSYCAGHTVYGFTGAGVWMSDITCAHWSWNKVHFQGGYTIAVRYNSSNYEWPDGTTWVDAVRMTVNYTYGSKPGTPAAPSILADGVGSATVSSNTPSDGGITITNVQHQVDDNPSFNNGTGRLQTWTKGSAPSNPQTHQFTGCTADEQYWSRARYYNAAGWGNYGSGNYDYIWDQSNAPAWAATKFTARTVSSITFDWITPTDLGNCNLIEYWYWYGENNPPTASVDTNSTNTFATKGLLLPGTKYYFQVAAITQWGQGVKNSSEFHWTLCTTVAKPTVAVQGDGILRVTWGNVTGGDNYRIRRDNTDVLTSVDQGTPYDDNTVVGGISYVYDIQVQNEDGNWNTYSADSDPVTAVEVPSAAGTPTFSSSTTNSITFTWSAAAPNGGTIIEYHYDWKIHDGSYAEIDTNSTNLSATKGTLASNTKYLFNDIHATNEAGHGADGPESGDMWTLPTAPTLNTVTANGVGQLRPAWSAVTPDPVSYTMLYDVWSADTEFGSYSKVQNDETDLYYDNSGLGNGTTKWYKIIAQNPGGEGAFSNAVSGTTWNYPTASGTPTLDSRTTVQIIIDYTVGGEGGGTPPSSISDYEINWKIHDGVWSGWISEGMDLTATISSLTQNTKYYFKSRAVNAVGGGAESGEGQFYTVPTSPTGLTVVSDAVERLTVSWSANNIDGPGGDDPSEYDVRWDSDGSAGGETQFVTDTTLLTTNQTTLGNGTNRWYDVRIGNQQVESGWATKVMGTTWTVPGIPPNVEATSI